MIDLSFIKDINFTDANTLIFLAILLVPTIIVFFIFFAIISGIIKLIKRIIIRLFNMDARRPKLDQKNSTEWLHKQKNQEAPNPEFVPKAKKDSFVTDFKTGENLEQKKQSEVETYKEKETQNISEGLGRLKGEIQEDDKQQEIKVPTPRRFQKKPTVEYVQPAMTYDQKPPAGANDNHRDIRIPTSRQSPRGYENQSAGGSFNGLDFGTSVSELKRSESKPPASDSSIFGGKPEISRRSLEHELRYDTKAWKAQREVGLNLSPAERAKLVKETFSPVYGRNISKSDLRFGISKLNRKLLDTKSPTEHAKIRKEIKFFKKIGGIK